jgi:hypothetical protein
MEKASSHSDSTLRGAIDRCIWELDRALCEITAHNALDEQDIICFGTSFFQIAIDALWEGFISRAIRVLDDHHQCTAFWYIYRCNQSLAERSARKVDLDLDELRQLTTKLMHIRTKTQFHIDRESIKDPESIWSTADIDGGRFALLLQRMALMLMEIKHHLTSRAPEPLTRYDASDIPKIVGAYEQIHGPRHGVGPSSATE